MKQQTEMHPILAKFHEAKEAGFEWADDAINAFDEESANAELHFYLKIPKFSTAVGLGFLWGRDFVKWSEIYEELKAKNL